MTQTEETKVAVMQEQINYIKTQVDAIILKLDNNYVTKEEYNHCVTRVVKVEEIINRLVWIIVTAFLSAILASVIIYTK
jgi:ABC-type bacteriocin/lantibiotic exporter with double-glycine peptidase domain